MKKEQLAVALMCLVSESIFAFHSPLEGRPLSDKELARREYIRCNAERKRLIAEIGRSDPMIIRKLEKRISADCRSLEASQKRA